MGCIWKRLHSGNYYFLDAVITTFEQRKGKGGVGCPKSNGKRSIYFVKTKKKTLRLWWIVLCFRSPSEAGERIHLSFFCPKVALRLIKTE